jgi:acyl dehydratase
VNTYTYDEIEIGHTESFHAVLSEDDMAAFRKITGDENPLHCDDVYAARRGYPGRLAYGMLTASYLSTLAGMYLPGERGLIHEVTLQFTAPNFKIGGGITVTGKVADKHDRWKRLDIKAQIVSDDGVKLLRGLMKVGAAE